MKRLILAVGMVLISVLPVYAVTVSLSSSIQVNNAPTNSQLKVECGPSTGVYTTFTKLIPIDSAGIIPVVNIFDSAGNFFCRTSFIVQYGQGSFSAEIPVTITAVVPAAPSLTVIP